MILYVAMPLASVQLGANVTISMMTASVSVMKPMALSMRSPDTGNTGATVPSQAFPATFQWMQAGIVCSNPEYVATNTITNHVLFPPFATNL
jgi:hypothetical protein